MFLIHRALALRARRPHAFTGGYVPVAAGEEICAFLRGEDVLVVVRVRAAPASEDAVLELPPGTVGCWRDLLGDDEISLAGPATVGQLGAGFRGLWLLERQ